MSEYGWDEGDIPYDEITLVQKQEEQVRKSILNALLTRLTFRRNPTMDKASESVSASLDRRNDDDEHMRAGGDDETRENTCDDTHSSSEASSLLSELSEEIKKDMAEAAKARLEEEEAARKKEEEEEDQRQREAAATCGSAVVCGRRFLPSTSADSQPPPQRSDSLKKVKSNDAIDFVFEMVESTLCGSGMRNSAKYPCVKPDKSDEKETKSLPWNTIIEHSIRSMRTSVMSGGRTIHESDDGSADGGANEREENEGEQMPSTTSTSASASASIGSAAKTTSTTSIPLRLIREDHWSGAKDTTDSRSRYSSAKVSALTTPEELRSRLHSLPEERSQANEDEVVDLPPPPQLGLTPHNLTILPQGAPKVPKLSHEPLDDIRELCVFSESSLSSMENDPSVNTNHRFHRVQRSQRSNRERAAPATATATATNTNTQTDTNTVVRTKKVTTTWGDKGVDSDFPADEKEEVKKDKFSWRDISLTDVQGVIVRLFQELLDQTYALGAPTDGSNNAGTGRQQHRPVSPVAGDDVPVAKGLHFLACLVFFLFWPSELQEQHSKARKRIKTAKSKSRSSKKTKSRKSKPGRSSKVASTKDQTKQKEQSNQTEQPKQKEQPKKAPAKKASLLTLVTEG